MRGLYYLISTTILIVAFQNCGKPLHGTGTTASNISQNADLPPGVSLTADPALQAQALQILESKCASCHQTGASGGVTQILNVNHLVGSGLVVAGDPTKGALVDSIQSGRMPLNGSITAGEIQTIRDWISSMVLTGTVTPSPTASPLPAGKTVGVDSALHTQAMQILNTNCAGCHQGINSGGINDILNVETLVRTGLVTAGNGNVGRLVGAIVDGSMPKGTGARVTNADLTTLRAWIAAMQVVDDTGQAKPLTRPVIGNSFTAMYANVIQPKCVGCHGPNRSYGGKRYDSYTSIRASSGDILSECQSNGMPRSPYPSLTTDELNALRGWINAGRLNN